MERQRMKERNKAKRRDRDRKREIKGQGETVRWKESPQDFRDPESRLL